MKAIRVKKRVLNNIAVKLLWGVSKSEFGELPHKCSSTTDVLVVTFFFILKAMIELKFEVY